MLDLILVADDEAWATWHGAARRAADGLRASLATTDLLRPAPNWTVRGDAIVEVLRVAESFELDLTETPAHWRSLQGLAESRPDRVKDLTELVDLVRRSFDESMQDRRSPLSTQQVLRSVEFRPVDSIDFGVFRTPPSAPPRRVTPASDVATEKSVISPVRTTEELLDRFKDLTLTELEHFVKAFEEKFEVTAAPVAVGTTTNQTAEVPQESFDVILESVGEQKIQVIKTVRELTSLGLGEAKAVVDMGPKGIVIEAASAEVAGRAKSALEQAGAAVTLRAKVE